MAKVKVVREQADDDTFNTLMDGNLESSGCLDMDDEESDVGDGADVLASPLPKTLSLEEQIKKLRAELRESRAKVAYWKSKSENSSGEGGADGENSPNNDSPGFWERSFDGLREMVILTPTQNGKLKSKISFGKSGIDLNKESVEFPLPNGQESGLHHRRSTAATTTTSYFEKFRLSPFKFYSNEQSSDSSKTSASGKQEAIALVKSHASDRDEDSTTNLQDDDEPTFFQSLVDRGSWLVGLLVLQSFSSFILKNNEKLLQRHVVIVRFLTMLVGAGGNAGNQASVRVIRGLATGQVDDENIRPYLIGELKVGFFLSILLGVAGCIRAAVFFTPAAETFAITASLVMIVAISILLGTVLPLLMKFVKIDPAHSSTTIQVIMDILGVAITVSMSALVLDSNIFGSDGSSTPLD